MSCGYRIEEDLLGQMEVPEDAYYGIHSLRACRNFQVSRFRVHPELIRAMGLVKKACAMANVASGLLDKRIGEAVVAAAGEVADGRFYGEIIVDPFQGGAGTSTNMNVNEVIANRAIEILGGRKGDYSVVHPNDHVNMSQSTNDVYPTALRVAAIRLLLPLSDAVAELQQALQEKEAQFAGVLKIGRTEMQDAVPITLGQEFGAFAEAIARDRWRIYKVEERLRQVNLGGTAIGTGLLADRKYIYLVIEKLRELTGLGLARAENPIDVTQNADVFVEVSGLLKALAVNLLKIAADLRLMSSGPGGGLQELKLPRLQAGSSIMPGKVNPVATEMITQVAYQTVANDTAITLASQAGQLELNAFLPLVAFNLLEALEILTRGVRAFTEKCIRGVEADTERCRELLERGSWIATVISPYVGYETASKVAREAMETGRTVREVILARRLFSAEELDQLLTPQQVTRPGIPTLEGKTPGTQNPTKRVQPACRSNGETGKGGVR